jgi:hypothetical protein
VLKAMMLWSRKKKIDDSSISFTYDRGTLSFIQKMLVFTDPGFLDQVSQQMYLNQEAVFLILVALTSKFPRLFSVTDSVLTGDCFTLMRMEMLTFKALIELNLPLVF